MGGLKRNELQKCRVCERGVMHSGQIMFYRMTVEHHVVDLGAVQRLNGLEQMISPVLASVMGPNEDLSKTLDKPSTFLLCVECACTRSIAEVLE
jgi:hypothetical protein